MRNAVLPYSSCVCGTDDAAHVTKAVLKIHVDLSQKERLGHEALTCRLFNPVNTWNSDSVMKHFTSACPCIYNCSLETYMATLLTLLKHQSYADWARISLA